MIAWLIAIKKKESNKIISMPTNRKPTKKLVVSKETVTTYWGRGSICYSFVPVWEEVCGVYW